MGKKYLIALKKFKIMKSIFNIKVPHLNANEDEVKIVEINFTNYDYVKKDENVCSIESSKITQELTSEEEGYIKYMYSLDSYVKNDEIIAIICQDLDHLKSIKLKPDNINELQITKKAEKLIKDNSISLDNFLHLKRIIKEKDVINFIEKNNIETKAKTSNKSKSKNINSIQKEIAKNVKLSQDTNATTYMTLDLKKKMIEILCNEKSKNLEIPVTLFDLLTFKISSVVKEFPLVNSYLDNDYIIENSNINLGFTVERNNNLYMPVIKNLENKNENDIIEEKFELVRKIYKNEITSDIITGGTISIASISSGYIKHHYPIIYPSQSTIIGIGSLNSSNTKIISDEYIGITVAYDHRIINGNYCSSFIENLIHKIEN